MLVLRNVNSDETFYLLCEKQQYNVGRAGSMQDIVLHNDTSISRRHAVVQQVNSTANAWQLEDLSSKFGTFYNDRQLRKDEKVALKDGDKIRFGLLNNVWQVSIWRLCSMSSALSQAELQQFEQYMKALSGHVSRQWDESCTHLTMSKVTITLKVLHALLQQIPIVTCNYWRDLLKAIHQRTNVLPKTEEYTPHCCESIIQRDTVDLQPRTERKRLFAGMTFIFMNRKHFEMYSPIVQKAGAKCKDFNSGSGVSKAFLVKDKVVVIQYVPSTQSQSSQIINNIENYLESHSRRIIPEFEIGLAIMHCCTEKYCNPSYKIVDDLISSTIPAPHSQSIFTQNTHASENRKSEFDSQISELLIPETEVNHQTSKETSTNSFVGRNIIESTDSMPNICIMESGSQQSQNKRKHPEMITSDVEEDSFQFSKRAHVENMRNKDKKVGSQKAVDAGNNKTNVFKTNQTNKGERTIDVSGFLEKPNNSKNQEKSTNLPEETLSVQRKRPHIAVITEDDDDGDLFNFGDNITASSLSKKARSFATNKDNNSEEELFGFTTQTRDCVDKAKVSLPADNIDLENTEPFEKNEDSKKDNLHEIPKPMPLPKKVSTEGWLSCSLGKIKLETNDVAEVKDEKTDGEVDDNDLVLHRKWVDTLKSGCQVHLCTVDLTKTKANNNTGFSQNENSINSTINFKKFVKNYQRPCRNEIRTT